MEGFIVFLLVVFGLFGLLSSTEESEAAKKIVYDEVYDAFRKIKAGNWEGRNKLKDLSVKYGKEKVLKVFKEIQKWEDEHEKDEKKEK